MSTILSTEPLPRVFPDDKPLYEIVNGVKVELPPMSAYATTIASILIGELYAFVKGRSLGRALAETLFHLGLPVDRNRRPDVAFVSFQRWPKDKPQPEQDNAWDVVPNLAIEVTSPSDIADDLMQKIAEYFQAGVQMVWVVYPRSQVVQVFESLTSIRVLTRKDELDGGAVLPGFRLPLTNLFQERQNGAATQTDK